MADGHVISVEKELREYYFYNVRGSSYKDDKFTIAIKDEASYALN